MGLMGVVSLSYYFNLYHMSFYSALTSSLHKVQDNRGTGSVASNYPLQTLGDFGDFY